MACHVLMVLLFGRIYQKFIFRNGYLFYVVFVVENKAVQ